MSRTHTNDMTQNLPQCWVREWRAAFLRKHAKKTSILSPTGSLSPEQRRQYRFGPTWSWWNLSEQDRQMLWEEEEREREMHCG